MTPLVSTSQVTSPPPTVPVSLSATPVIPPVIAAMYNTGVPYHDPSHPYFSLATDQASIYNNSPLELRETMPNHPGWPYGVSPYYPYDPLSPYLPGYGMTLDATRRKNATREATTTLKQWLNEHQKNPYPTKGEKIMLAIITKMSLTQVSTWFANARRRLKKENKMTWEPRSKSEEDDDDLDREEKTNYYSDESDKPDCDEISVGEDAASIGRVATPTEVAPIKPKIWSVTDIVTGDRGSSSSNSTGGKITSASLSRSLTEPYPRPSMTTGYPHIPESFLQAYRQSLPFPGLGPQFLPFSPSAISQVPKLSHLGGSDCVRPEPIRVDSTRTRNI